MFSRLVGALWSEENNAAEAAPEANEASADLTREETLEVAPRDEDEAHHMDEQDEHDLQRMASQGGSVLSLVKEDSSTGAEWAPWKSEEEIKRAKARLDLIENARDGLGVIDARLAICALHGKKRLIRVMTRMSGPKEAYHCIADSECKVDQASDVKRDGTKEHARYYGTLKQKVHLSRRMWKKVCWECGIGEHEKYNCRNKLCPSTGRLVCASNGRGYGEWLAWGWQPKSHTISPEDMANSECGVCGKKGSVNCCSLQLMTTPTCTRCLSRGHTSDDCFVNLNTNYHSRPQQQQQQQQQQGGKGSYGGKKGTYQSSSGARPYDNERPPVRPPSSTNHPQPPPPSLALPAPSSRRPSAVVVTPEMKKGMRMAVRLRPQSPPPPSFGRGMQQQQHTAPYKMPKGGRGRGGYGKGNRGGKY